MEARRKPRLCVWGSVVGMMVLVTVVGLCALLWAACWYVTAVLSMGYLAK